jgi:hypothetical protein
MFFAMQLVFADCLLFWSALFGLQWSLPAQLVLLAAGLRSVGSFSWLVQMRPPTSSQRGGRYCFGRKTLLVMVGAPAVLMLVASTHSISHRRVPIGPLGARTTLDSAVPGSLDGTFSRSLSAPQLSVSDTNSLEYGCADAFLVFGLSLAPMLIWGLSMARCGPCQTQVTINLLTTSVRWPLLGRRAGSCRARCQVTK